MTDSTKPRATPAVPALGDVVDVVVELAAKVTELADRVDDLERVVWRLERGDRERRRDRH